MESGLSSATVTPTAAAPAPAPPAPTPAAPAPAAAPAPMSMPSSGGGKLTDMVKRLNPLEIGFGILGAAALYYTIYYFKYNMTMSKGFRTEIENKVDELTMKVSDVQSAVERDKAQAAQGFF